MNIVFWDKSPKVTEPLFLVAKLLYSEPLGNAPDRTRAWNPWLAYLTWNPDKIEGTVIELKAPEKRVDLLRVAVVAVPLSTIESEARSHEVVQLVRAFEFLK